MSSDYPIIIYRHEDDEDYTSTHRGPGPIWPRELHPGTATSTTPSELEINMGHVITCRHSCEDIFKEANRAVKNAETISNPRTRNSVINNHYANLYEAGIYGDSRILPSPPSGGRFASPNYWSGMATIVSFQLGCMMAYSEGVLASEISTKWMRNLLGEANLDIFKKMYPPMLILSKCGYDRYLECIKKLEETGDEQYKTYVDLKPAIEKMRDGDFRNAADFIVGYEQKEINQRYYDENPWAFRGIRTGGFMTQKKHIPVTIECNSNKKPVTFNGNLTDYNDRIQYFWDLMNAWNGSLR